MRADHAVRGWMLALAFAAAGAVAGEPTPAGVAPPAAAKPVASAAPRSAATAAATDPELLEFLAEFSADDGAFVDPFALDKVGKAVDREIEKLDAKQAQAAEGAAKPAPPVAKEADDDHLR